MPKMDVLIERNLFTLL